VRRVALRIIKEKQGKGEAPFLRQAGEKEEREESRLQQFLKLAMGRVLTDHVQ